MPTDFYDVLGAPADASSDELKRAYRSRVREYHPDVNDHPDGDDQFKLIRKANEVLTDPGKRKDYDRLGHREYAKKHLDDLPPFSVLPEFEDSGSSDSGTGTQTSTGSTSSGTTASSTGSTTSQTSTGSTTSQTSTGSNRSRQRNRTRQSSSGSSSTASGSTTSSSTTSRSGTSTSRSRSASSSTTSGSRGTSSGRTRSSGGESDTDSATAGAETGDSSQWADVSSERTQQTTADSTTPAGVRRRRGLRRWYGVALVALLTYVGGVGTYVLGNRSVALDLVRSLQTAPVSTLLGTFPLRSPTAYVVTAADSVAAGTPVVGLLLLAGTVLLPLVVLTAVAQYGHGSAWAYALASLGPAVTLAAYPFVLLPVGAVLVGLVVLPLISGLGFLVDVGRYLLATR